MSTRKKPLSVIIQADGAVPPGRGGGPAGAGAVVIDPLTRELLSHVNKYLGMEPRQVADYVALIIGLRKAVELGAVDVLVQMDSRLVIKQMAGDWQVRAARMQLMYHAARQAADTFATVKYELIPPIQNGAADWLAKGAILGKPSAPPPMLAGLVATARTAPTMTAVDHVPQMLGNGLTKRQRVTATASLAARYDLAGLKADIAAELVTSHAQELRDIWDNAPSAKTLTQLINASPLAWADGLNQDCLEGILPDSTETESER